MFMNKELGKAPPCSKAPPCTQSAGDEGAGTPAGVLRVREQVSGGIAALNHRLPAGKPPASSSHRLRRGKETPKSEPECDFVTESIGEEWVMRRDCPEISNPKTGFSMGDGLRQRPAADLGRSAKRTGLCHPFWVVIAMLWLPGVSRGATPGYSNGIPSGCAVTRMAEASKSGGEFVPEGIGGELVMREDCPELSEQITDSMRRRISGEKRLSARGWARSFLSGRRQSARGLAHSMPWRTLAAADTCAHTRGKGE